MGIVARFHRARRFIARAVARYLGRQRRDLLRRSAAYAAPALVAVMLLAGTGVFTWNRLRSELELAKLVAPVDCKEEGQLRSLGLKIPTSITFTNKGEKTIRLYWLNHEGERVLYGTLERLEVLILKTYVTHPWVVTDIADECKAIYMPAAQRLEIPVVIQ